MNQARRPGRRRTLWHSDVICCTMRYNRMAHLARDLFKNKTLKNIILNGCIKGSKKKNIDFCSKYSIDRLLIFDNNIAVCKSSNEKYKLIDGEVKKY